MFVFLKALCVCSFASAVEIVEDAQTVFTHLKCDSHDNDVAKMLKRSTVIADFHFNFFEIQMT